MHPNLIAEVRTPKMRLLTAFIIINIVIKLQSLKRRLIFV